MPLPSRLSDARRRPGAFVAVALLVLLAIAAAVVAFTTWRGALRRTAAANRQPPVRVTLVSRGHPPGSSNRNIIESGPVDGLRAAARDLGVTTTILWDGQYGRAAATSDLVILGATPYPDDYSAIARLARRYPKKRFVVQAALSSELPFSGLRNVTGIAFDDRELGYLAGYLAALTVRPHQAISAVGGIPVPAVRELIVGYKAGAAHARPSVRVIVDYSNSFIDQRRCERLAGRQIDRGAKVVFDVAGSCGFGAMQAAEIRGVWGLGVDSDLSYLGPQILASAVKRIDRAIEAIVALDVDGKLPRGGNVTLNLANDAVGLVGISDQVPEATRRKLETVAAKLRAQDQAPPKT